jgi:uncharacterized protein
MNPIQSASFLLDLKSLKALKPNRENIQGALLAACSAHHPGKAAQIKVLSFLLKLGANVDETDKNGVSALHRAVRFRSITAVRFLLESGANPNLQDRKSFSTPLHRAVTHTGAPTTSGKEKEAEEIIQLLLKGGANPILKNKLGKKPADYVKKDAIKRLFQESPIP